MAANGADGIGNGSPASMADPSTFNDHHFSAFVAMEVPVTIVPRFSMGRVDCLSGSHGPFIPNYPMQVPLWLALHLRQTDTCTITPPAYLRTAHLAEVLQREQAHDTRFEPLPYYFFEIAKKLCEVGSEDIQQIAEVMRYVHDLKSLRQRKLQRSMAVFEAEGSPLFIPGIKLTNIVSSELHFLRHSFAVVLQQAYEMDQQRQLTIAVPVTAAPARASTTLAPSEAGSLTPSSLQTTATAVAATLTDTPSRITASLTTDGGTMTAGGFGETDTLHPEQPVAPPPAKRRRTLRQT